MISGSTGRSPSVHRAAGLVLPWGVLLFALAVVGCAASPAGITGDGCRSDGDCLIGVCNPDHLCAPRCVVDAHCPETASCQAGVCVGVLRPSFEDGGAEDDGGEASSDGGVAQDDGGVPSSDDGGGSVDDGGAPALDGGTVGGDGGTAGGDGGHREQCHNRGEQRACGSSLGTCRLGTQECTGEFWGPCVGSVGPSTEQCDGQDHDCDGIPDNPPDGCACRIGETRACYNGPPETLGVGSCHEGTQTCVDGRWGDCSGAVTPVPGRCDVLSCTGGANPGCGCAPGETRACFDGRPEQANVGICRSGTQTCVTTVSTAAFGLCVGEKLPEAEQCDGLDHDCNGHPDDRASPACECRNGATQPCYDGPPETRSVGTCRDGTQTCVDGHWGSCTGAVKPIPGSCLEASCAGTPNPGCVCIAGTTRGCYDGPAGTQGVGLCRGGTQTCVRGSGGQVQWGACVGEKLPEAEQCDGQDHDCNGTPNDRVGGCACVTGQSRACYDGPPDTRNVGTCHDGTQSCTNGQWGACTGQVAPVAGNCTVASCAGGPNPGCACTLGDLRSCYDGPTGTAGVGLCHTGTQRCVSFDTGGVGWGSCLGEKLPEPEQCDGLDHDCNGRLDDRASPICECRNGASRGCYNGPAGTQGVGTCAAGTQSCVDGHWGACTGAVEPQPNVCGVASCTGPNNPNPGCPCIIGRTQSCYDGPTGTLGHGICVAGTQTCVATATASAWSACTGQRLPETERCDNLDHDCNGVLNDRPGGCVCTLNSTQSCYDGPAGTAGVGTCHAGTQTCVQDTMGNYTWSACSGEVTPQPGNCAVASCTGPNNPNPNCQCINGRTQSCYTGPTGTLNQGICAAGTQTCVSGAWGACAGQTLPDTADLCVPPGSAYSTYKSSDRTCNGVLDRHNPVAQPTLTASSGMSLSPPTGFVVAVVVEPLDTVTLHGAATDSDGTTTFSYRWRLLSAPQNNTAGLSGAPGATTNDYSTQQAPTLFAQLAGDYVVGVRALDASGCQSDEVQALIRVKPHSAIHIQLTWDHSVDLDLQMVQGATTGITFSTAACYWGNPDPTTFGTVNPHLDIDDLAGCNPENINFGTIGGTPPTPGTYYGLWVHYYCNRRGHRPNATNPSAVCYEPTTVAGTVTATVKIYVDGNLAKIDGSTTDAIFAQGLTQAQTWKPATLYYDPTGVWRITRATTPLGTATASACTGSSTCVCSSITNTSDPYCGTSGAACRQRYP